MSTQTPDAPASTQTTEVRTRSQVVENLVEALRAHAQANGKDKNPIQARIRELETELVDAPLSNAKSAKKGVVDIDSVLTHLRGVNDKDPNQLLTSEELAEATSQEPTPAIKARIVHNLRRDDRIEEITDGVGKQRRQGYRFKATKPAPVKPQPAAKPAAKANGDAKDGDAS